MKERKPAWLRTVYDYGAVQKMDGLLSSLSLNTVCKEANCPNIGDCYRKNTATFMIMGSNCTRNCRFCAVLKEPVCTLDPDEPQNVATAASKLGLKHVVVTSVTRDDLPDGGAEHFAATIRALKTQLPESTVEVLIPDMQGCEQSLDTVIAARPDVIGHNIETVPSLYGTVRPEADYRRSLDVLQYIKQKAPDLIAKTGIMVGLGETDEQVFAVMDDLVAIGCDILTIGQYLQPTKKHLDVVEYVPVEKFNAYKTIGEAKGIGHVASAPLVRSSYNAVEALRAVRGAKL